MVITISTNKQPPERASHAGGVLFAWCDGIERQRYMGGRGAGAGRGGGGGLLKSLPKLQGSEKQVKWAEEIRQERIDNLKLVMDGLDQRQKTGSPRTDDPDGKIHSGEFSAEMYYRDSMFGSVDDSMKNTKLHKDWEKARKEYRENPTKELKEKRTEARKKYYSAVAKESKRRLAKAANKDLRNAKASYWIDHRP